ncbi:hypothetical protein YC2023_076327 [Brassica napus]
MAFFLSCTGTRDIVKGCGPRGVSRWIYHHNDILFLMRYTHFPLYRVYEQKSPNSRSSAAVLKEKCKIDLCVMRITGSKEGESADADTASCYYDWLLLLRGIHVVTTTQEISESKDQRSLKKIVHTFMKDDGGEQYLRLPTAVVVVVTAKTYHKIDTAVVSNMVSGEHAGDLIFPLRITAEANAKLPYSA